MSTCITNYVHKCGGHKRLWYQAPQAVTVRVIVKKVGSNTVEENVFVLVTVATKVVDTPVVPPLIVVVHEGLGLVTTYTHHTSEQALVSYPFSFITMRGCPNVPVAYTNTVLASVCTAVTLAVFVVVTHVGQSSVKP
jgi:hypothetical protein